jgi:hypothetical protein
MWSVIWGSANIEKSGLVILNIAFNVIFLPIYLLISNFVISIKAKRIEWVSCIYVSIIVIIVSVQLNQYVYNILTGFRDLKAGALYDFMMQLGIPIAIICIIISNILAKILTKNKTYNQSFQRTR